MGGVTDVTDADARPDGSAPAATESEWSLTTKAMITTAVVPGAIADVVGQSFLSDPGDRQRLLEMDEVTDRLTFLVGHLSSLLSSGGK